MSFSLENDDPDLLNAVLEANGEGILMMCATPDTGKNKPEGYPAEYQETISFSPGDRSGNLLPNAVRKLTRGSNLFNLPSQNIFTGSIPFLTAESVITGSSVTTAIACGLASLVLSCWRLRRANQADPDVKDWQKRVVLENFRSMVETTGGPNEAKSLDLNKFAGSLLAGRGYTKVKVMDKIVEIGEGGWAKKAKSADSSV